MAQGVFPFGQRLKVLRQEDRSPKRVFVLGVYASAVHARWTDSARKQRVSALAVASEPRIFWTGDNAHELVAKIRIPPALGGLSPAAEHLNGASGRSLDSQFLAPLGLTRDDVWLCDLYPFTMLNDNQLRAIRHKYSPIASRDGLARPSLQKAPTSPPGKARVKEVMAEIRQSEASILLLLGDLPIAWFLNSFQPQLRRLAQFGKSESEYGRLHSTVLDGKQITILPVVHPRQASRLGRSTSSWGTIHDKWAQSVAPGLLR